MQCYFGAQVVPALAIGSSLSWLPCLLDILYYPPIQHYCVLSCFHCFLTLQDPWQYKLILYIPWFSPRISHSLGFKYQNQSLVKNSMICGHLFFFFNWNMVSFSVMLQVQSDLVYTQTHTHIYIYILLSHLFYISIQVSIILIVRIEWQVLFRCTAIA